MTPEEVVTRFWKAFDEARFEDVRPLLAEEFIAEWPQTGEAIRGPDNLIALNSNYPGRWRCRLRQTLCQGDQVVSRVDITDGAVVVHAVSFFTVIQGRITHAREYFADTMDPPFERGQWTEPL